MVKMCVCHRKSFEEIYQIALQENFSTTDELVRNGVCGGGCGMCHPYLNKMMATGITEFSPGDVYISSELIRS
jgi:bacterioferritin-associated ferredoxin